jgi:hypothetical protein
LRGDALERPEVNERSEGIEDADLHVPSLEADRIRERVSVDGGARHRGMDEADVDLRQTGLPRDRPLCLSQGLALDRVDELLELGLRDRLVGLAALLAVRGGEPLDELARDPDDDLGRSETGHLLGLLESDRTVVDDRGDVGDGARLHVRQTLTLAADAADRTVPGLVDLEHESLRELGPDVERRARGERLLLFSLPDPAPEGHGQRFQGKLAGSRATSGLLQAAISGVMRRARRLPRARP